MRDYDEEDPRKPKPVHVRRKGESGQEAQEHVPVGPHGPKDEHYHHHRHVIRC